jgi:hypothetical protein
MKISSGSNEADAVAMARVPHRPASCCSSSSSYFFLFVFLRFTFSFVSCLLSRLCLQYDDVATKPPVQSEACDARRSLAIDPRVTTCLFHSRVKLEKTHVPMQMNHTPKLYRSLHATVRIDERALCADARGACCGKYAARCRRAQLASGAAHTTAGGASPTIEHIEL